MVEADGFTFDTEAARIIRDRLHVLNKHAAMWACDDPRWDGAFATRDAQQRHILASEIIYAARGASPSIWLQRLRSLAEDLGMIAEVKRILLRSCLKNGWFNLSLPHKQQRRPKAEDLEPHIFTILDLYDTVDSRTSAFIKENLCRDSEVARLVAQAFMQASVAGVAISRVCGIIRAWDQYGYLGLLHLSDYPFYEEMRLTEEYVRKLPADNALIPQALPLVRADVIALCRGIQNAYPPLWHQNLLYEPCGSIARERYQKRLFSPIHEHLVAAISQVRPCTEAEAEELFTLFIQQGLPGIIDWRFSKILGNKYNATYLTRINHILDLLCVGLPSSVRVEIECLTACLFTAIQNTGIQLPLVPLLKDAPSSRRRVRLGRRITFGVPSIVRQKHRKHKTSWPTTSRRYTPRQIQKSSTKTAVEQQLITMFANLVPLNESEATSRLRNVITYGVLGFLPKSQWYDIVDGRLLSWLRLIKFGHVERAVPWSQVYGFAQAYSANLGITIPSSQILRAIYKSIAKPRHWHGGRGLAVVNAHQRLPRIRTERPRLHNAWIIIKIKLNLKLLDTARGDVAYSCYLLLVVDEETQLPVGGWISVDQPQSREVGLAIYQAIWHPGAIQWPIRGIPQVIRIPQGLVADGCEDIQRAASYLLADVDVTSQVISKGKRRILRMVEDIKDHAAEEVYRVSGRDIPSESRALRIVLDWLLPHYFPHHRTPAVRASTRENLVGMPGYDTPAAGWLLPVTGMAEIVENDIVIPIRYRDRAFKASMIKG
jgi:hypothetical protein